MRDPREVLSRPAPDPDRTLRYGPEPDQVVDLRLPPDLSRPRPLVVVLHGGFWRAEYDRAHAGPQASGLAAAGYVVAVPEYRRSGQPGGGWPGTFDDVARVTDQVADLVSAAVGEDRVDRRRTVLVGHSAGGHLALWAAARHRLPRTSAWHRGDPLPVRGVLALAGVCDLALSARLDLDDCATRELMAGTPDAAAERYALADPARLLPSGVRSVLVHGRDDVHVPVEVSRSYAEAAEAVGDDVRLVELARTGHYEVIDPLSDAWPVVLTALDELLR